MKSWACRLVSGSLAALSAAAMPACSFSSAEATTAEQNTCVVDSDCGTQQCEAGRCVSRSESALNVALVVTPKRMPDGSQPSPIVSSPFALHAGQQGFDLQLPASVPVNISSGGQPFAAQVTFTPMSSDSEFSPTTTQINTVVPGPGQDAPANNVLLADGAMYSVLVQPTDSSVPPHSLQFTASVGATLDVDYDTISWQSRVIMLRNVPGGTYNVRARAKNGGAIVSSTALVGFTGVVSLQFDPGDVPYQLELTPVEQGSVYTPKDDSCTSSSPKPTLVIDSSALTPTKGALEQLTVTLPDLADPITYTGTVTLCANQKSTADLQMSLKSSSLIFGGGSTGSSKVTGHFEISSAATWDADAGEYNFCMRVLPGDYTVVVTPPANVSCEIFAEHRLVSSPDSSPSLAIADQVAQGTGDLLALRTPATLSARIQTPDNIPMANASIDLNALGKSTIMLAEDDRTVPLYNRSRQLTSAIDGTFSSPVDLGTYDVIVKPPANSNYAWRVLYGVEIGSRTAQFSNLITLSEPVVVSGALRYVGGSDRDQKSLASADVHAYTIVDQGMPTERTLELTRATADANGNVTLLLPPSLQRSWIPLPE